VTRAPERIESPRLVLRRPRGDDASRIFARYASDPEVTRLLSFRTHRTVQDTEAFLAWSDSEWERWPAGPYLVEGRLEELPGGAGALLGSTGLAFETPTRAATGYVLARDAWGRGFATEALREMAALARALGVIRLYALCHPEHHASLRVLEKNGFAREGTLRRYAELPNLKPGEPSDLVCCALVFG
jgi:RimJ/RimL family protein N-acetyltransferase